MNELLKESLGLESIDFQSDDFFDKIEEWVRKARQNYKLIGRGEKSRMEIDDLSRGLSKLIKDRTNINTETHIWYSPERFDLWSVYALVPVHNVNSAMTVGSPRSFNNSKEFMNLYEELSKRQPGYIDNKKAKVHGFFSEVKFDIVIGVNFIKNMELTTHNIASIILHEIGHCWNTLELMSFTYRVSQGMSEFHRALTAVTDPADRKYYLDYISKKEQDLLKDHDVQKLCEADAGTIVSIVISERVIRMRSQTGALAHEKKTMEDAADVFAARFGAADHLAKALLIGGKNFFEIRARGKLDHYTIQTMCAVWLAIPYLILGPFGVVMTALIMFFNDPMSVGDSHSAVDKRIQNMKNQLISRLKDAGISKELRDSTLNSIKIIDKTAEDIKNNYALYDVITRIVNPWKTSKVRKQELMYHLEAMANNKLFASAAKIKTLS